MKRGTVIFLVAFVLIAIWGVSAYNGLVKSNEAVAEAWAKVESQYQRRSDLIPNLVATVKGYASHESQTLQGVVEARAAATQINIDAATLTPETLKAYQQSQGAITSALGRLLAVQEAYPDLKANQNFSELQAQLEGTENRIATERMRFNEVCRQYNTAIKRFPMNLLSGMFGFDEKPYFESAEGSDKAPTVEF